MANKLRGRRSWTARAGPLSYRPRDQAAPHHVPAPRRLVSFPAKVPERHGHLRAPALALVDYRFAVSLGAPLRPFWTLVTRVTHPAALLYSPSDIQLRSARLLSFLAAHHGAPRRAEDPA